MAKLHSKYDGDLDVAAVYAEALMVRKPWALWVKNKASGEVTPADNNTLAAKDVLEKVRQDAPPPPAPPYSRAAAEDACGLHTAALFLPVSRIVARFYRSARCV